MVNSVAKIRVETEESGLLGKGNKGVGPIFAIDLETVFISIRHGTRYQIFDMKVFYQIFGMVRYTKVLVQYMI